MMPFRYMQAKSYFKDLETIKKYVIGTYGDKYTDPDPDRVPNPSRYILITKSPPLYWVLPYPEHFDEPMDNIQFPTMPFGTYQSTLNYKVEYTETSSPRFDFKYSSASVNIVNNVEPVTTPKKVVTLFAKVALEGPYNAALTNGALMNSGIRSYIPLSSSHLMTTEAITNPSVLTVTGNDAIVDWVLIELRSIIRVGSAVQLDGTPIKLVKSTLESVPQATIVSSLTLQAIPVTNTLYKRAALLQADGDIVDVDGVSPITFENAAAGNYFLVVKQRNHLSFRSNVALNFSLDKPTFADFVNGTVPAFNGSTQPGLKNIGGKFVAYSGDANFNGTINANDYNVWNQQKTTIGYKSADYNLDGVVNDADHTFYVLNVTKISQL